jgi:hypothetical protein
VRRGKLTPDDPGETAPKAAYSAAEMKSGNNDITSEGLAFAAIKFEIDLKTFK